MATTDSPNLNLPYILAAQAQKHVTHNEAVRMLDAIVQLSVRDRDLAAPPPAPADGDRHIVAAAASGAWTGKSGEIAAYQDGAWAFYTPREGWTAWIADEDKLLAFNGSSWVDAGTFTSVPLLGINATADATNKLAVSSEAILFNHNGAGVQEKLNKNAAGDTASMLFQTGFSGRAELGTTGDDDLHLKVSPDGSSWKEAMVVDRSTGAATFAYGSGQMQVDVFTASGSWDKPAWARRIEIWCVGGGGGGGSGRRGAAGTDRRGGGGGAAGSLSSDTFLASELGSTLSIVVGAGGTGAAAVTTNDTNGVNATSGGASQVTDAGTIIMTGAGGTAAGGGQSGAGGAGGASSGTAFGLSNQGGNGGANGAGSGGGSINCARGPGGGGGGGAVTSANAASAGGAGGNGYAIAAASPRRILGGSAGTASGGAGGTGGDKGWQRGCGAGGGGGGAGDAAGTVAGGAGGAGGAPGGGGGGGGGSANGANSGAGGAGGRGEVWIISMG